MNANVSKLLNEQINKEFYSAYLYLDFANYYAAVGLDGFENWYRVQAQEEYNPNAMICYLLHSEFFKKGNLYFHQFFTNSQLLLIHIANSKPWERFIFLSVPNEKIVPYQLIFTENEIELWA